MGNAEAVNEHIDRQSDLSAVLPYRDRSENDHPVDDAKESIVHIWTQEMIRCQKSLINS
jgi:hypothetical protein